MMGGLDREPEQPTSIYKSTTAESAESDITTPPFHSYLQVLHGPNAVDGQ